MHGTVTATRQDVEEGGTAAGPGGYGQPGLEWRKAADAL